MCVTSQNSMTIFYCGKVTTAQNMQKGTIFFLTVLNHYLTKQRNPNQSQYHIPANSLMPRDRVTYQRSSPAEVLRLPSGASKTLTILRKHPLASHSHSTCTQLKQTFNFYIRNHKKDLFFILEQYSGPTKYVDA